MSFTQDDISNFHNESPSTSSHKRARSNTKRILPVQRSLSTNRTTDIQTLFTIKSTIGKSQSDDSSELSDDVFVDKPVSAKLKSYRDKINDRFKKIKEKARESSKKAKFKETTQKILLDKVRRESNDVDVEIETVRSKFQLNKNKSMGNIDFFCSDAKVIENTSKEIDDKSTEYPQIQCSRPELLEFTIQSYENDLFFKPNGKEIEISQKTESGEVRNLEEDGLFVPKKLDLPQFEINLLEQRLLNDNKNWFNCDGQLKILSNPLIKSSFRPPFKPLPSDEITIYMPARKERSELEEIVVIRENILELQTEKIFFLHHPLFSAEHVFERKLLRLFDEHTENIKYNKVKHMICKVDALRQLKKNIETHCANASGDSNEICGKIDNYNEEIHVLQNQIFEEGKKQRTTLKDILQTWKIIKKIRKQNGYSNTTVKLVIHKENVDYNEEKQVFDNNLEVLLKEIIDQRRNDGNNKKRKHRKNVENDETSSITSIESVYDEDKIRDNLKRKFNDSLRPPGEPILIFSLSQKNEITKTVNNAKENSRRNSVSSTKIFMKIICNKLEVCKSKMMPLNDDFSIDFHETYLIQLVNIPKFLILEIYEQTTNLLKRKVGEVTIDFPSHNNEYGVINEYSFEKSEVVRYKHEGIGSGIRMDAIMEKISVNSNDNTTELNTSGFLQVSLNWEVKIDGENHEINYNKLINEIIDKNGTINVQKLKEWLDQNKPDPQDPKNSILFEYLIDYDRDFIKDEYKNYFRLNPFMEKLQFCNMSTIEDNIRLKILQLRNNNEPEFDGMIVPNRIKEIPFNILDDYNKRVEDERNGLNIDEDDENFGEKTLKQIQIKVFQKCKSADNHLTFDDVVNEKYLTNFQNFIQVSIDYFLNWFRWRPKFQPSLPKIVKNIDNRNSQEMSISTEIKIRINSAINVPNRCDGSGDVQPFVEIYFNNCFCRTSTKKGQTPVWDEEIHLPLEPSHTDYLNPNSLSGSIILNLFDETDNELTKRNSVKIKNWLGYLEIPLSAICYCSSMHGLFKVKSPNLLFDYQEFDDIAKSPKSSTPRSLQQHKQVYLDLNVYIEPNIPKLTPSIPELPSSDLPYLRDYILKWNESYNCNFPHRKFSAFAIDTNGTTTCIVRYIKPLEPPQINPEGFDLTPQQCLRFISLIPFTDCNQFYHNIWLTTGQFLHLMIGSVIDHVVALTCYLLALKLDVWMLLGFAIPHGFTAFVLQKEFNDDLPIITIYDVVYGERTQINDAHCPLQRIFCVINETNIWANVQRTDNIGLTRFDFTRKSDWLMVFNNQLTAPTNSIQNALTYKSETGREEYEIHLERRLKKRFSKLRPLQRTVWNNQISTLFKEILVSLEMNLMYNKSNCEIQRRIRDILNDYTIRGHCIHLPNGKVSKIIKSMRSFGIHLVDESSTEFALTVSSRTYPNRVTSLWIFLASIVQKTEQYY